MARIITPTNLFPRLARLIFHRDIDETSFTGRFNFPNCHNCGNSTYRCMRGFPAIRAGQLTISMRPAFCMRALFEELPDARNRKWRSRRAFPPDRASRHSRRGLACRAIFSNSPFIAPRSPAPAEKSALGRCGSARKVEIFLLPPEGGLSSLPLVHSHLFPSSGPASR